MTFFDRSVTLIRREATGIDAYGNDVLTTVEDVVEGCAWNPRTSTNSENVDARQQVVSGLVLYVPPGTPVAAVDAVIVEGRQYEVDGEVGSWGGSLSDLDHIEVPLRRVAG